MSKIIKAGVCTFGVVLALLLLCTITDNPTVSFLVGMPLGSVGFLTWAAWSERDEV